MYGICINYRQYKISPSRNSIPDPDQRMLCFVTRDSSRLCEKCIHGLLFKHNCALDILKCDVALAPQISDIANI